jgi:CopG family nickel-responsive transcriptional regulator
MDLLISGLMAKIVSFSLNENSFNELNLLQKNLGFSGKSETVRAALSALSKENDSLSKLQGNISAILIITHSHDSAVTKAIHKYEAMIVTHIHQHVKEKCVEIFMLKGDAKIIRLIFQTVLRTKTVFDAKIVSL